MGSTAECRPPPRMRATNGRAARRCRRFETEGPGSCISHDCLIWDIHLRLGACTNCILETDIYARHRSAKFAVSPLSLTTTVAAQDTLDAARRRLDVDPRIQRLYHHSDETSITAMPGLVSDATRIWELNVFWPVGSQCGVWDSKTKGVDVWACIRARMFLVFAQMPVIAHVCSV